MYAAGGYALRVEPLFAPERLANRYHRKLGAATELHNRWLKEALKDKDALSSPSQVRDCLFVFFAGQGYESFVTLFLDMQNRLIAGEELFRANPSPLLSLDDLRLLPIVLTQRSASNAS